MNTLKTDLNVDNLLKNRAVNNLRIILSPSGGYEQLIPSGFSLRKRAAAGYPHIDSPYY